jgi:hypothetical protein
MAPQLVERGSTFKKAMEWARSSNAVSSQPNDSSGRPAPSAALASLYAGWYPAARRATSSR